MKLHRFVLAVTIAGTLAMGVGVAAACNGGGSFHRGHVHQPQTTTTTAAPVVALG